MHNDFKHPLLSVIKQLIVTPYKYNSIGFLTHQKLATCDEESMICDNLRDWKEKWTFYKS